MEPIYENQREINEALAKFISNLKKTAADRRTSDYFRRRLDILQNYWVDYERNHKNLCKFGVKEHPYFIHSDYESTLQLYQAARDLIGQQQQELGLARPLVAAEPKEQASEIFQPEMSQAREQQAEPKAGSSRAFSSKGTTSKLDDLLRKQTVNFTAFMRTARNIRLESISEKWEFDDVLKELLSRWSAIDSLHWEIYMELNGEDEEYEEVFTRHENTYINLKKAINQKMWSAAHREKSVPQMDIPVFSGTYQQWTSFKDLFNEAIHNNPSLSPAQKMQFLKGKLRGEAERLIQHLQISSSNYNVCWEILNNRYNNKKLIFTSHLNTLLNLPNMSNQTAMHIKRMHDVTLESLHAISNLGVDVTSWDPILVHILSQKLDSDTFNDYIDSLNNSRELPVLKEFLSYLENKFTSLESSRRKPEHVQKTSYHNHTKKFNYVRKPGANAYSNNISKSYHVSINKCALCKGEHGVPNCSKFTNMSSDIRLQTANKLNLCINCLFRHTSKQCISTKRCHRCHGKHNTLLHDSFAQNNPSANNSSLAKANQPIANNLHVSRENESSEVLLATAMLKIKAEDGSFMILRALIDQGSQISLISENAAQRLGVKRSFCRGIVYGLGEKENNCKGMLSITCSSIYNNFTFSIDALIMNNLIKNLPTASFRKPSWSFIQNIELADKEFWVSRPVDLLLGSDIYALIKMEGICRGDEPNMPIAEQTQLGWILFGKMQSFQCNVVLTDIDSIQKFWEVEDVEKEPELSSDDNDCVEFYLSTTKRRPDGRYVVRLPMKHEAENKIGKSRSMAIAQLINLEKKFLKQSEFSEQYKGFMSEYIGLQHMVPSKHNNLTPACFLPHHGVQRVDSRSTKLRVVFNASAKTSSGYSLNDLMFKGPNLQKDLQCLMVKWRIYPYAFAADIEKMYRQILVSEEDQPYQQILWRESPEQLIQAYQLTTVTYGTKAAPFLAMMTLHQLAADESSKFPEASRVLREAFYMDDLLHGSFDIESGKRIIKNINSLLKLGGFQLRKWMSNDPELLECIEHKNGDNQLIFNFNPDVATKTLGLLWNPKNDRFTFKYLIESKSKKMTKRIILGEISRLFDPLGWIAPLTTKLKLIFQNVWSANLHWDDEIPENINLQWMKIKLDIPHLSQCEVPRWIGFMPDDVIELHGFCDASIKAYACVIYARVLKKSEATVALIASKTRLVPYNKKISLPRLEVCGAHLLSKLMDKVLKCLECPHIEIYCWTDSMVVLSWLQGDPGRWKTFISNRVKSITEVIPSDKWRYVKSGDNPADAASRGLLASELANHTLWWRGPEWLKSFEDKGENRASYSTEEELKKRHVNIAQACHDSIIFSLLKSKSSLTKIIRVLAWILRAAKNISFGMNNQRECNQKPEYLTLQELKQARLLIIKYVQRSEFGDEFNHLLQHNKLPKRSKLLNLDVFLDKNRIMRVGGRLHNARICAEMKHPIVIPSKGYFTTLLIQQGHHLTYHGGPKVTQANLRQRYWIVSGNRAVKKEVRNCVKCRKHDPVKQFQFMGNLPEERINPAEPFYHTGVDYTGYVEVKANKGRGIKTMKGYIALFICMVTKAVHLELVSDLSSSAFLAALRRMAARRGAPKHIYSDNGTNFVGASRILKEEYHDLKNTLDEDFYNEITDMNIEWHFNAPSWPSAGGLWERAVRSVKHHLKRVVGEQKLTFEEYTTLLAQVEAVLNSRPLCPLSENPDDLDFLTPAHFLTGRPGTVVIETEHDARTRWHLTSKLALDIWKRFKTEYLTQLSVRSKWLNKQENIKIGDMVTIQDENLPPGKWLMGRVIELHPGHDSLVRVVSLKTKNGVIKRPILKLSVLPIRKSKEEAEEKKEDEKETGSKRIRRQAKHSFVSMAISLILFMTMLGSSQALLTVTALKENQGFYFDQIGDIKIERDVWKLVAYYNMEPYWEGITTIEKYTKYLDNICSSISKQSHCDIILSQLKYSTAELEFNNLILLGQRNSTRARRRRGLINGVGYLANSLFGVLDEHFAEQYQRDINEIRRNENHMRTLWRNQTSVIEGQYNVLKRMEETISKQHKIVNQNLNSLERGINSLKEEIKGVELINEFTMSIIIVSNLVSNLRSIQDQLLDMITDVHHERYSIHLLSHQQLQHELNIISGHIPKDLALPIDNISQEMANIYKLLKVKARMTNEYFLFEILIPLVMRENFELHKIIAVPHQSRDSMISIIPAYDYVGINLKRDIYVPIGQNEKQQCIYLTSFSLCNLHTTFFHLKSDTNLCVKESTTNHCQTSISMCSHKWIKLNEINSFLYACCNQCVLRLICDDRVTVEQLTGSGILHLAPNCLIKEKDFTAYSIRSATTIIKVEPNLHYPKIAPINHILNISLKRMDNETSEASIRQNLETLGQQINELKNQEIPDADSLSYHHIHHYVVSYLLMAAAAVAAGLFLWRWWSQRRAQRPPAAVRYRPSPSPNPSVKVESARKYNKKADRQQPSDKCSVKVKKDTATSPAPIRVYRITDVV